MDDDTHKGDSDSDWDSTLDFTSHRQAGVPVGQFRPKSHDEIEEESALSGESDLDVEEDLPIDQHVINNVLKPTDDRQRAPSPNQKENNIVLAQKQRQQQQQQQQMREQPANQSVQQQQQQQQQQRGTPEPPYNFREALTDNRHSPVPKEREAPGKNRKGTTYDPAPSPTPRGIIKNQGSIKSVGSWDDSDPDEKTLREIRTKYRTEKQREELKNKEDESVIEEAPQTARSETTWKSWTGKFGKKKKGTKNNDQSQASVAAGTPRTRDAVQTTRSDVHSNVQHSNVHHSNVHSNVHSGNIPRLDVTSPSMIQVQDQRYSTTPNVLQVPQAAPVQYVQKQAPVQYVQNPVNDVPMTTVDTMIGDEPRKLFVKDDDAGRYVYYFGHGNLRYFEVNEDLEEATLPPIADKVDQVVQRVWQEVFAVLRIVFSIVIWFIVELFRFLAKHIFQPLIVGIVVTVGDYIVKPFLSAVFNGIVQPGSIFCWNMFSGMRHMFTPVGEIIQRILEQFAMLFRSIRLFEINYMTGQTPIVQTV